MKGEWVGFIGESGAGKSTFFQLLIHFYDLESGCIRMDDIPIDQFDLWDLRKKYCPCFAGYFLISGNLAGKSYDYEIGSFG